MPSALIKDVVVHLNLKWRIPNAVFVLQVTADRIFSRQIFFEKSSKYVKDVCTFFST